MLMTRIIGGIWGIFLLIMFLVRAIAEPYNNPIERKTMRIIDGFGVCTAILITVFSVFGGN